LFPQHWLSAVQAAFLGRQQFGSLADVQEGPQQPSLRPQAAQVFEQLAVHVPGLLQTSAVHATPSLHSAPLEQVAGRHAPPQQI
jgi:hypothetical protein